MLCIHVRRLGTAHTNGPLQNAAHERELRNAIATRRSGVGTI
jgi:hypothetical protein